MIKGEAIAGDIPTLSLIVGFIAAFVSGCLACKWMIMALHNTKTTVTQPSATACSQQSVIPSQKWPRFVIG